MKKPIYFTLLFFLFINFALTAQWDKNVQYVIRSASTGEVLTADGKIGSEGCKFVMRNQNNGEEQLWRIETLESGKISIRNFKNKHGLTLNRQKENKSGEPVAMFEWGGNDGQKWRLENVGGGFYVIRNVKNKLVLDANRSNQYDSKGRVVLTDSNGGPDQKWRIQPANEMNSTKPVMKRERTNNLNRRN